MVSDQRTDEVASLVSDLVAIETENPPGNERACAEFIDSWFEERGIATQLINEPYENRPQVLAHVGDGSPTVILNGHIDVVPAGDLDHWSHDPYGGEREGSALYGRGSVDMKTGVALAMMALDALREPLEHEDLHGSVVFHAAIGEETAEPGTKTLLDQEDEGDYGIVLEPTEMRTATSEKGLAWYEFTISGDPSHASRPDQGTNAIIDAQPFLEALTEYDSEIRKREDELVGRAYATVTKFEAGTKENVLPENAVITIDRRFLPSESAEEIDSEIDDIAERVTKEHGIDVSWERTRTYESATIDTDSPLAEVFRRRSSEVSDVNDAPWGIQASTDVRNFINDAGIDAITWGPGDISQAHTYDEHIDIEAAATGLEVLELSVQDLLEDSG